MNIISSMRAWLAELFLRRPSFGIAALAALLLLSASLGHEGLRVPQMLLLALPGLIWLRWPVRSPSWRRLRLFGVAMLLGAFLLDGFLRAYLRQRYAAVPDSTLVLTAAANTSPREALEYLMAQGAQWWPGLVALLLALGLLLGLVRLASQQPPRPLGTGSRWLWLGLLLLCCVAHASKPWRRHHPAAFWPHWAVSVETLRMNWSDQSQQRELLLEQARASGVRALGAESSTVVLVLTDSVNRDNMSLYGYPRETTPQLQALSREEGARLLVLPHAWSVQATTVAALDGLFSLGGSMAAQPGSAAPAPGHILALARAAGYRVWWMSNHDDLAIEQQHAQLADTVEMINREPGRSSSMLDGELLDSLEVALADRSAPRKLIVLHLLGAHPHYRLRAPEALRPFEQGGDAVEREMQRQQRPVWLREQRQDYDAVIHYHDGWLPRPCECSGAMCRQAARPPGCICRTMGRRSATASITLATAQAPRRAIGSRPCCGVRRKPLPRAAASSRFGPIGRAGRWPSSCASNGPAWSRHAMCSTRAIAGRRRSCRSARWTSPADGSCLWRPAGRPNASGCLAVPGARCLPQS